MVLDVIPQYRRATFHHTDEKEVGQTSQTLGPSLSPTRVLVLGIKFVCWLEINGTNEMNSDSGHR